MVFEAETALFIKCVESYPTLYLRKGKDYSTLQDKDACWKKIAEQLDKTPQECKHKWRTIRDNYRKNRKKVLNGEPVVTKYDDDILRFLDKADEVEEETPKKKRKSTSSDARTEKKIKQYAPSTSESYTEMPVCPPAPPINPDSPIHVFFRSMADIVCGFPPEKMAEVRLQVCNLVTTVELQLLKKNASRLSQNMGMVHFETNSFENNSFAINIKGEIHTNEDSSSEL